MLYKQYAAMERGDWEATARQFYTANASIARRHLLDAGGFDEAFRRAEDVELAYRLADRGLRFTFAKDAVVDHHAERSFASWLDIARQYGRNDVIFGRDLGQRWLLDSIATEFHGRHRLVRALTRTCAPRPRLRPRGDRRAEGHRSRRRARCTSRPVARQSLSALYNLAYYGGMADELGSGRRMLTLFEDQARRDGRCGRASASSSSRRSATSPTPTTCSTSSAPTSRSTPCSHRSPSTSRAGRPACPGSATGPCAPGSAPAGRSAGCARAARSTPCSSTPRCRRSCRPTTSSTCRRSCRSTRRRSSTTSSAPTTATTPAAGPSSG